MPGRLDAPVFPPAEMEGQGGGGGSEWIGLVTAAHDIDAHLLAGRLGEAGIETRMVVDRGAPGAWLYGGSNPWAPVAVLVRKIQLEDARLVLAEISLHAPAAAPRIVAPAHRRARWTVLWWTAALTLGLIFTAVSAVATARAAGECHLSVVCPATDGARP